MSGELEWVFVLTFAACYLIGLCLFRRRPDYSGVDARVDRMKRTIAKHADING